MLSYFPTFILLTCVLFVQGKSDQYSTGNYESFSNKTHIQDDFNREKQKQKIKSNPNTDIGQQKIFLQPNQKYDVIPALLFDAESSFKVQYKLQIIKNKDSNEPKEIKSQPNIQHKNSSKDEQTDLYQIHPALQKISSYQLTDNDKMSILDCSLIELYFSDDNIPFIFCLRKSKILQSFRVDDGKINFEYSFNVSHSWNHISVVSPTELIFYNISNLQFYSYNKETKSLTEAQLKVEENFIIEKCKTFIEESPDNDAYIDESCKIRKVKQESLHLVCYTNNNLVAKQRNKRIIKNVKEIKKDYVIVFLVQKIKIQQLNHFQLLQKNASTLNHIVGFDIIDSLQNVIMISYNLYKIDSTNSIHVNMNSRQNQEKSNVFEMTFVSSFCSIFKIYLQTSQMVLINRMLLQSSPYPLLQTSLQINVMLAVATQTTITIYHLDVLKEMFEFVQKIGVPSDESFNCYEFSQLRNSFQSLSLTCAKDQDDTNTVSFVMIFSEDMEKYIPVGDTIVGKRLFHTNQLIYTLDGIELNVHQANQQYVIFNAANQTKEVKIYEASMSKPDDKSKFTTIIMIPAEYGQVYVDRALPLIKQNQYDVEDFMDLKGVFEGSNISALEVQAFDEKGNPFKESWFEKNNRILSYDFSYLVSVYIKEECIRVIKIDDISFYRILQIEKSRVDEAQKPTGDSVQIQTEDIHTSPGQSQTNQDDDQEDYYYYTQTCSKIKIYYVCELTEVHSISSSKSSLQDRDLLRVQSTKKNKVVAIEYLSESNTFMYLYELISVDSSGIHSINNYGVMFISMIENQKQNNSFCYQLTPFISQISQTLLSLKLNSSVSISTAVDMKKDWLILGINHGQKSFKVFCLIINVKKYLFASDDSNQKLSLKRSCIFRQIHPNISTPKQFIQEDRLILSEIQIPKNSTQKLKKITVYNVHHNQAILKQGSYYLETDEGQINEQNVNENGQFIGLYKQYMIVVNKTTISKYHVGIKSELLYQFVFNPDFQQEYDLSNITRNHRSQEDAYPVKYVLFLEHYLIVQFESFYQLYNIKEELVSIQIAAYNYNAYIKSASQQEKNRFSGRLNQKLHDGRIQNIIINDAFLIEGDNIVIYQKNHLLVAKYITNPTLQLGPFSESHLIVQKTIQIRLTPVLDYMGDQQMNEVHQQVFLKILYSHYVVQKIAKNIKILTVPSKTQNFELQIWTNVFRGPVLEYYLSDNFNGQIVLKQHIRQLEQPNEDKAFKQNPFFIIQYHRPFPAEYNIRTNLTHLLIEQGTTKQIYHLSLPEGLRNEFWFKYLHFSLGNGKKQIICLLTQKNIVFVKVDATRIVNGISQKYFIVGVISHKSHSYKDSTQQTQIEVLFPLENNQSNEQNGENLTESFVIALLGSPESQNPTNVKSRNMSNCIYLFQVEFNQSSQEQIIVTKSEKFQIDQEILQIRSMNFIKTHQNELILLTYMQNFIVYELSEDRIGSILKEKQRINLKDFIPVYYRSDDQKYVKLQIFNSHQSMSDNAYQNQSTITMLLFSSTDKAFHVEFQITFDQAQNSSSLYLNLKNIYTGYPDFQFIRVIEIVFQKSEKQGFGNKTFNDEIHNDQNVTKPRYRQFVLLYEYGQSQERYLTYYGYNYNFSKNGQVGYFKCGQQIDFDIQNTQSRHTQNPLNQSISLESSHGLYDSSQSIYYLFQISPNSQIKVQVLNVTAPNNSELIDILTLSVIYTNTFQLNSSIYMYLNYQKPPIVSYILLNARNFNVRTGIYTKFIFIKDEVTWTAFYIIFPFIILLFVSCAFFLKKHQPKQILWRKNKQNTQQTLFSDQSRVSSRKEERVICIESSDEEQSSNYRDSLEKEEANIMNPRLGYVSPDKYNRNRESSILQSPFKTYHPQKYPHDIDESDIQETPISKRQLTGHQDDHSDQEKEILSYLISKKSSFGTNKSSFS